ncbi:MAG TPA: peptidoglycan-binding domain-containing protein [Paracoccaceae bacterium]|nr:peptidoglycan-binding domain-containing protein [Paracoccaceae bacterium]
MTRLTRSQVSRPMLLAATGLAALLLAGCTPPPQPANTSVVTVTQSWPAVDEPMIRLERQRVQQLLTALGYPAGSADGIVTERTRVAIRAYQVDKGYRPDGVLSSMLLASLQSDAARLGVQIASPLPTAPVATPARPAPVTPAPVTQVTTTAPVTTTPVTTATTTAATSTAAPETPPDRQAINVPFVNRPIFVRTGRPDRDRPDRDKDAGGGWN